MTPAVLAISAALLAGLGTPSSQPFTPRGNSTAVKEKILAEFPGAEIPAAQTVFCSSAEHSYYGPASYCFAEFTAGATVNVVEAAVHLNLAGTYQPLVAFYGHTTWERIWVRCGLRKRVPGKLFSNDDCGKGQPEQPYARTDPEMVEFDILPRIRSHKPLRSASRAFSYSGAAPALARYRASRNHHLYTFTNAVGDSFRYRP